MALSYVKNSSVLDFITTKPSTHPSALYCTFVWHKYPKMLCKFHERICWAPGTHHCAHHPEQKHWALLVSTHETGWLRLIQSHCLFCRAIGQRTTTRCKVTALLKALQSLRDLTGSELCRVNLFQVSSANNSSCKCRLTGRPYQKLAGFLRK